MSRFWFRPMLDHMFEINVHICVYGVRCNSKSDSFYIPLYLLDWIESLLPTTTSKQNERKSLTFLFFLCLRNTYETESEIMLYNNEMVHNEIK